VAHRFRSQYEAYLSAKLTDLGQVWSYEVEKIPFVKPEENKLYCPDFRIEGKGFFIEAKGLFSASDRKKHKLVRECNPDIDIRFVFQNAYLPITKSSKTTCAMWAEKNGFLWAHKVPPSSWFA